MRCELKKIVCTELKVSICDKYKYFDMKGLTKREEEIMNLFWAKGPMFVKELIAFFDDQSLILIRCLLLCEAWKRKALSLTRHLETPINIMRLSARTIMEGGRLKIS